jgi:hypothetical protein
MCTTGQCVAGVCSEELLVAMESCTKNSDCESRRCAGGEFVEEADQVCCPNGESYKYQVDWSYAEESFCGDLPVNTTCGSDRLCATGLCIAGQCATEPLPVGSECLKHTDCEDLGCALIGYQAERMECCPNGDVLLLHFAGEFIPDYYCANVPRPIRAHCTKDSNCESGACVSNMCL